MSIRSLNALFAVLAAVVVVSLAAVPAAAQGPAPDDTWTAPRTAFGHPDLQGVWANNNATPLQRPEVLGDRAYLTDEELASIQSRANELFSLDAGDAAFGDTVFAAALAETESFTSRDTATRQLQPVLDGRARLGQPDVAHRRSAQRAHPAANRPRARRILDARSAARQQHAGWTDDRSLGERCLSFGAPRLGAGYNSYYQLFQTPNYVVIQMEMAHDARIIPLDGRPHVDDSLRQWLGDSRGHWEGDTLVVETTNYSPQSYFMGSAENLEVTERFTRVGPDVLQYEVTLTDATTWTAPWSVMIPLRRSDDAIYEYACHEGNIGMEGILAGARVKESQEAASR